LTDHLEGGLSRAAVGFDSVWNLSTSPELGLYVSEGLVP
jgi:hypothetical protein